MKTTVFLGSRNPEGFTARAAKALIKGVEEKGSDVETVFLPALKIERCRQCDDQGWGICRSEGRCIVEDDLSSVVEKLRSTEVAVFATPVYFSDLSESLRAFLDRLRRICMSDGGKEGIKGKPAIGICVAGLSDENAR